MYFRNFVLISPWKRAWPFIWTSLLPLLPRMLCAKFGWNWPSGSGDFLKFVNVFLQFRNYHPLEKGGALHLNKLESPSHKNALCKVWLKLARWFWRRRWKCEKFMMTTTTTTTTSSTTTTADNGQILIRKAQLSFRLRWAKKEIHIFCIYVLFVYISIYHA